MKKLLIATTALVATASVAAADVSVSGDGRMGILDNGTSQFSSRIRIKFTASGETDGGLTFGGSVRLGDQVKADGSAGDFSDAGTAGSVFIGGDNWKATMGDIDSAMEKAIGDVSGVGYTCLGCKNETGYIAGGDDTGLLLQTSFGGATVYASVGQRETGTDEVALGVSYAVGGWTIGAGYEDADVADSHYGLSVKGALGAATVKANYTKNGSEDQMAVSVDYAFDATTVTAFYRNELAAADTSYYGLGVAYDLGGGAAIKAGYLDSDLAGADASYDLGVTFKF